MIYYIFILITHILNTLKLSPIDFKYVNSFISSLNSVDYDMKQLLFSLISIF